MLSEPGNEQSLPMRLDRTQAQFRAQIAPDFDAIIESPFLGSNKSANLIIAKYLKKGSSKRTILQPMINIDTVREYVVQ